MKTRERIKESTFRDLIHENNLHVIRAPERRKKMNNYFLK
jgi:hypothetical protein